MLIAENAKSGYKIVISERASPSVRHSAMELQNVLKEISGALLPIDNDRCKMTHSEIIIGDNQHLNQLNTHIHWNELGVEGFTIRTVGEVLVIAGDALRGAMYGVNTFLENYLGCRWYSSNFRKIPRNSRVEIGEIDDTQVPALEYRETFFWDALDGDWAAHNKQNGNGFRLDSEHGGKISYQPFVHTFEALVPPEKYFQAHPEFFSEIDGKRVKAGGQLCLTNPEVLEIATGRVYEWICKNPEANIFSVSQNDCLNFCQCDRCSEIDGREGTPMGTVLHFVNSIADRVAKDHSSVAIDTLAYQYTRRPPKTIKPRKNVIIRLCSIECCFSHPIATCDSKYNARFVEDIKAWSSVHDRIYIWDYVTNFRHYLLPFPNFGVLKSNIQFFINHGVKGIFEEGNYESPGDFSELRAWIIGKLLWQQDENVGKLINEFTSEFFGKSASFIRKYIDLIHNKVQSENIHVYIYDGPDSPIFDTQFTKSTDDLLDSAESLAENEIVAARVRMVRLSVWYALIMRDPAKTRERDHLIEKFIRFARTAQITHVGEGKRTLDKWITEFSGGKS